MKKTALGKLVTVIVLVLVTIPLLSACDDDSRIPVAHYFSPNPATFATNINSEDPRRQVNAVVTFEVIDEAAIEELATVNHIVRHSVLTILGQLTMEDMIENRNLDALAERLVSKVNEEINTQFDLVIRAYFTEFFLS